MPVIFEIFGHRLDDRSEEAQQHRQEAWCPFMARLCDGGGNRYLSEINLASEAHTELAAMYPGKTRLPAGVCSLQPQENSAPWIVCPRRLLSLGREAAGERKYQKPLEEAALKLLNYPSGTELGVWSEAKLQYSERIGDVDKQFDYTFDYILMPLGRISLTDVLLSLSVRNRGSGRRKVDSREWMVDFLTRNGYSVTRDSDDYWVENYPIGRPSVIEIMTSSTSGGNKKNRSTIPGAFEDAMLGKSHRSPTINKRQVWARMVSQLIVKSEIALGWGGKTIWVVQDVLVDYINQTTGLNVDQFASQELNEVNLLSFSYSDSYRSQDVNGVLELPGVRLYAGPIEATPSINKALASFADILRTPVQPPLKRLVELLISKGAPVNRVIAT